MSDTMDAIQNLFAQLGVPHLGALALLLLGAALAYWLGRVVLVRLAHRLAKSTANTWDDALIESKVISRLAQLLPGFIIYLGVDLLPRFEDTVEIVLLKATSAYMILVLTFSMTALLDAVHKIYESYPAARQRPLKGFVQLLQLGVIILGTLLVVAELLDRSPWLLLSGFGAMTAILMLVFRDTIMSLVASVQLSAQDLVRIGDWIEVPAFGADGDVVDVQLHTIQVQNWDKTLTTIPTHALVGGSFKNWRGMYQSGGRRIKRCLYLDTNSVRFLSDAEVQRFKRFTLLRGYVEDKQAELAAYNQGLAEAFPERESEQAQQDGDTSVNLRRLTNIGTFRAYVRNYLAHHPRIHQSGMTLLVRHLPPGAKGIPIELYCFTNTTDWVEYEGIQGDIFDHLLAITGEFGLRVYQQPSGADLERLTLPRA